MHLIGEGLGRGGGAPDSVELPRGFTVRAPSRVNWFRETSLPARSIVAELSIHGTKVENVLVEWLPNFILPCDEVFWLLIPKFVH